MMRDDWIQTYSGRAVCPTALRPEDVCLEDIAHSLSLQCRWTGHVREFYSVAEHCCLVSWTLEEQGFRNHAAWGLMHDATEAYLVDLAAPIKHTPAFEEFRRVERRIMDAICTKFELPFGEPPEVKRVDKALLATEAAQLMGPLHQGWHDLVEPVPGLTIFPQPPGVAKRTFIGRWHELTDGKWRDRERD